MRATVSTILCAGVLLAAAVAVGQTHAASPGERLKQKSAQAQAVLAQVNGLDVEFGRTVEAWNGARYELQVTRRELAADRTLLRAAQRQRQIALARVSERLVALYESDDLPTTVGIIYGSASVSDLIDRLDAAQSVTTADARLARQATAARNRYAATERRTRSVEHRRVVALGQLDAERSRIGSMLAQRRGLLASIKTQIASLTRQEAERQARLAAEARARLAREQAALREQARAAAAARAAEQKRTAAHPRQSRPPAATTTATTTATTPAPVLAPATTTAEQLPTATTTPATLPAPTSAAGHPTAATIALHYLGVRYTWGGATPAGFDCSGLVMYVFAQLGISLPHYAAAQYGFGTAVARNQLQPGDLVFFDGLSHVGIYIGGGQVVHAPQTGDVVKISPLADFGAGYVGARRI
jgi:peptidoglycan DL-endopeptidase CwlO